MSTSAYAYTSPPMPFCFVDIILIINCTMPSLWLLTIILDQDIQGELEETLVIKVATVLHEHGHTASSSGVSLHKASSDSSSWHYLALYRHTLTLCVLQAELIREQSKVINLDCLVLRWKHSRTMVKFWKEGFVRSVCYFLENHVSLVLWE